MSTSCLRAAWGRRDEVPRTGQKKSKWVEGQLGWRTTGQEQPSKAGEGQQQETLGQGQRAPRKLSKSRAVSVKSGLSGAEGQRPKGGCILSRIKTKTSAQIMEALDVTRNQLSSTAFSEQVMKMPQA